MLYKVIAAIVFKGDKHRVGAKVEMTAKEAAALPGSVVPAEAEAAPAAEEPKAEKPLDKMSSAELKAKAKELGLSAGGSAADIRERITLHLEGKQTDGEEPKAEGEGEETDGEEPKA